jgi:hypothetical protein
MDPEGSNLKINRATVNRGRIVRGYFYTKLSDLPKIQLAYPIYNI